jgi:hypothetical protein
MDMRPWHLLDPQRLIERKTEKIEIDYAQYEEYKMPGANPVQHRADSAYAPRIHYSSLPASACPLYLPRVEGFSG